MSNPNKFKKLQDNFLKLVPHESSGNSNEGDLSKNISKNNYDEKRSLIELPYQNIPHFKVVLNEMPKFVLTSSTMLGVTTSSYYLVLSDIVYTLSDYTITIKSGSVITPFSEKNETKISKFKIL